MARTTPLSLGMICWLSLCLLAHQANASDWVEATGQAMIEDDEADGRNRAIANALRFCIEQVTGVVIKSSFSHSQREILKNKKRTFLQDVTDQVTTESSGYIETYEILRERRRGDAIIVDLRAKVFTSKIQAQLAGLVDVLAEMGQAKMMLAVQDVRYDPGSDQPKVVSQSVIRSSLEGAITRAGGQMVAPSLAKRVTSKTLQTYDHWENTRALQDAKQFGADFILLGRIEVRNLGVISGETILTNLNGQTRIEIAGSLRGLDVHTGALLSSQAIQMTSIGLNAERALSRALKGRGNNMIVQTFNNLVDDLKAQVAKRGL